MRRVERLPKNAVFFTLLVILSATIVACTQNTPAPALHQGNDEGLHAHAHDMHHHAMMCERFITKDEADIPDPEKMTWFTKENMPRGNAVLVFYGNGPSLSAVKIFMMTSSATDPMTGNVRTRLSWEIASGTTLPQPDKIRTVHPDEDEMVCENPIVTKDGVRFDLTHLREVYRTKAGKT